MGGGEPGWTGASSLIAGICPNGDPEMIAGTYLTEGNLDFQACRFLLNPKLKSKNEDSETSKLF
jgi:hypothetical protein